MITLLLPAFNEESSLSPLLERTASTMKETGIPFRIIICNDGSTDKSNEIIKQLSNQFPLELINHKINRGLGETSRDLFELAAETSQPDDIIIRMDCDETHGPELFPKLIAKIDEGYDVVIASRYQPGGGQDGVSPYRAFISRCANLVMKFCFPISGLKEYSCGFRAYRADIIQRAIQYYGNNFIQLKGLGFTCTVEKLIKLKLLGARFCEIPFILRYDRKTSKSKMVSSITTLGYLIMLVLYFWPWGGWKKLYKKIDQ